MTDRLNELASALRDAHEEDAELAALLERRTEVPALARRARKARGRQRAGLLVVATLALAGLTWFVSGDPPSSSKEEVAGPRTPAPEPAPAPSVRGVERIFPEPVSWPNLSELLDSERPLRVAIAPRTMLAWELHPEDDLELVAPAGVFYAKRDARVFLGASTPGTYEISGRHRRRTFQKRDGAYALVEGPWRDVTLSLHVAQDAQPTNVVARIERESPRGAEVSFSWKEPHEVVAVAPQALDVSWEGSTMRLRPNTHGLHEALVLSPKPQHIIIHVPSRNP